MIKLAFDAHSHIQYNILNTLQYLETRDHPQSIGICGTKPDDWDACKELQDRHPDVFQVISYGLHPWFANQSHVDWFDILKQNLYSNPKAFIGEIGL